MSAMTYRMIMILEVIIKRNDDGTPKDIDQIIDQVDYEVTKPSIQFTLRSMVKRGLIEKAGEATRRGRKRITYRATEFGSQCLAPV